MKMFLAIMLFCGLAAGFPSEAVAQPDATGTPAVEKRPLQAIIDEAQALEPIEPLIVAHDGRIIVEKGFRSHSTRESTNIKSASKSIMSALVGIAIEKGILEGVDQKIAPILRDKLPKDPDPRLEEITIGHLLSMQAGLGRT